MKVPKSTFSLGPWAVRLGTAMAYVVVMNILIGVITAGIAASLAFVSLVIAVGLAVPIFAHVADKKQLSL